MLENITFKPLGDSALFVVFGNSISTDTHKKIQNFYELLQANPFTGMLDIVPGYTNICIHYDILKVALSPLVKDADSIYQGITNYLEGLLLQLQKGHHTEGRLVEIPVVYGGEYGPDLHYVANYHQLSEEEVIKRHTESECLVYMLGFAPGFAFMGGLDETIATPRKEVPRLKIPAGSVGIAGMQTGAYPFETPGGWQIIGRTPQPLFLPNDYPPTYLEAGDRIRFKAISEEQFLQWEANV
ncbi:5-oxoprolinase subunit PxpB [Solibacillus sp. CAU 1738]|uniref:5-oxoprolinase subunit PxpB n=1 Tax=Solibacillus sp. CAU 1738 TaxID=3140363 RepID=UPI003261BF20